MMVSELTEACLITIPGYQDDRGVVSVVDWENSLPFVPKRFYYIRNANDAVRRGNHAHWREGEVILALSGSFTVLADDGQRRREFQLDRPCVGLYIPPMTWHELYGFSADAICAVFASERFDPLDYCHDYEKFLSARER
jgi:UDP-2-acetamido-3-amino-2,3-dideoxy-glucuronate N-acetyltransferase